jgi:hypothetical protein
MKVMSVEILMVLKMIKVMIVINEALTSKDMKHVAQNSTE